MSDIHAKESVKQYLTGVVSTITPEIVRSFKRGYTRKDFTSDLMSGLIVGILALVIGFKVKMVDADHLGPHYHLGHRPTDGMEREGSVERTASHDAKMVGCRGRRRKAEAIPRLSLKCWIWRRGLPADCIACSVAPAKRENAVTVVSAVDVKVHIGLRGIKHRELQRKYGIAAVSGYHCVDIDSQFRQHPSLPMEAVMQTDSICAGKILGCPH